MGKHRRPNMVGRTLEQIVQLADLTGKVAIVTGATRGIGRETALALAKLGCNIVVAAKTTEPQPTLPGTIHTVAAEVEALGVKGLACRVDLRDIDSIQQCVEDTMAAFGRIDILINNASALWWQDIMDTPIKKYDLITSINARGTFFMTQACLPHMKAGGFGRIVNTSPPITLNTMGGHTAYNISKFGMTMVALGVSQEHGPEGHHSQHSVARHCGRELRIDQLQIGRPRDVAQGINHVRQCTGDCVRRQHILWPPAD